MAKRCNCWSAWVWQRYCPVHGDPKQLKIDQKAEEQREKEQKAEKEATDKVLDSAAQKLALDRLYPIFSTGPTRISNYLDVCMSDNYDHDYWVPRLAEQQRLLNEYRTWAETIPDARAKKAYIYWIEYYQKALSSGRKELLTQDEKNKMEETQRRQKNKEQKTKEHCDTLKNAFPSPPKIR